LAQHKYAPLQRWEKAKEMHMALEGNYVLLRAVLAALLAIPATSFADTRGGGEQTTVNVTLDAAVDEATDIWDTLESEAFTLTTTSDIIVTACSDVDNPAGATPNTYRFVISLDDTSPGLNTGSERTVSDLFDNSGVNDPESVHVCSTRFFSNVAAGAHTIYWLGSKASNATANTTVLDSSMTLGAFDGIEL
jgi:hypothetical protein